MANHLTAALLRSTALLGTVAAVAAITILSGAFPSHAAALADTAALQGQADQVAIDADDIGGMVVSRNGPEAGVWVIAETHDLPTTFRKIVVTDANGRFVLPDLPGGRYQVWVRGYGLVDSRPVASRPGDHLLLQATIAPNARAAAQIYPATYWLSLIKVPPASDFPGTGPNGNGISPMMKTQADWIHNMKSGCELCHQLGTLATRRIPPAFTHVSSSVDAWSMRTESGLNGTSMIETMGRFGRERALSMYADWSDRIAQGAVPSQRPSRPSGLERSLVLTMWDWGGPSAFVHDEITTDRRHPTVNANGPYYAADFGNDRLLVVDPRTNRASDIKVPVSDPHTPTAVPQTMVVPSAYWGNEIYWHNQSHPHNPMMDQQGRVWMTSAGRQPDHEPAFCNSPSNAFARNYPLTSSHSQVSVYDPKTRKVTLIDTCFGTHHLQFGHDRDNTLYFSGDQNVVGWLNTRKWDETHDPAASEGWCPIIVDTNGDGRIGPYTEPDQPVDPTRDHRISGFPYGIVINPVDESIWYAIDGVPGRIVRLTLGSNPPATCRAEVYEPPYHNPQVHVMGYAPRGIDVDLHGVIWTALSGSGQLASFDRRKCHVLKGPTATGQQCPEGWTLYPAPGPNMQGATEAVNDDFYYYNWVDQYGALGLGPNVPIVNGTGSDSLLALETRSHRWVVLRVPYPLGFYTRGVDGRIDNPTGGWKGRAIYADYGENSVWHTERGKGSLSAIVKFQLRPDPLAH